ncbi:MULTISPECIES: peptidase [Bacillaceae]|uniref:Acetylornithine deacetylase n=1 Tax=Gottfriedia luciferensis TaxID=178774 RepID=A0ABX2ZU34_9BACI|nr:MULTISPECIES: peptidase [Bacillaceae]ODG93058.1 acetylornithine deacetylase [Gottfriedia luciferensis]PGZ92909.1 acetylornithine deacetylase [Bacillus sp. AFS029533]
MSHYKKVIQDYISNHKDKTVDLLKQLVMENSVSGNESKAQAIVLEKLRELDLDLDVWEPDLKEMKEHPYFISTRDSFTGSPNIVATLKGTSGGKSMILNGHIDVVPEGNIQQWTYAPYSATVVDNKLYGRGATDMKGGNVALILAIEAIKRSGITLKGNVYFQSVIEEESGGAGTLATILRGYSADGVIIPEPTNMKFFIKQQGSMWFRLKVKGKVAHGGTRYEGVSAIEKSVLIIQQIQKLEQLRNERIADPLYDGVPIPIPINIGTIHGGTWPSSVSDLVTLEGRFGVAPNERLEDAKIEFENWIDNIKNLDDWFVENPVEVEWFGARWVPGTVEADSELVQTLQQNYLETMKQNPVVEAAPWGTDGGLFTQILNIPMIVFGPGETKVAHYPDEFIDLDQMFLAAEIIACTLIDWCGVEGQQHEGEGAYENEKVL